MAPICADAGRLQGFEQVACKTSVQHLLEMQSEKKHTMTEPTDDELQALWVSCDHPLPQSFARAVLAKWGQQAKAAGPVAYAVYDIKYGGSASLHWPSQHSEYGDAEQFKAVPLYTTPQPTQAVPSVTPCRKNPSYHGPRNCILGTVGCCEDHGKDRVPQAVPREFQKAEQEDKSRKEGANHD